MIAVVAGILAFAIVADVRKAAMSGDLTGAERLAQQHRQAQGAADPEWLEAYSWLGRGALAAKKYDDAERYAAETKRQALAMLKGRSLDAERHLPIALGAAIEVHGQALAAQGDRGGAIAYLRGELDTWKATSIRTRIQKNLNLLSLEGKDAPPLEGLRLLRKPALLFFWAHWCSDCKSMAPILAQVQRDFPGLAVIGPTQRYGYAERGREVGPSEEQNYIRSIQKQFYSDVKGMLAPVSEENFRVYGASTTPTLVLVDRNGVVRLYHPGRMTYDELRPKLEQLTKPATAAQLQLTR
jgi:thiol-disulfide isomerase/thioredoxin